MGFPTAAAYLDNDDPLGAAPNLITYLQKHIFDNIGPQYSEEIVVGCISQN